MIRLILLCQRSGDTTSEMLNLREKGKKECKRQHFQRNLSVKGLVLVVKKIETIEKFFDCFPKSKP